MTTTVAARYRAECSACGRDIRPGDPLNREGRHLRPRHATAEGCALAAEPARVWPDHLGPRPAGLLPSLVWRWRVVTWWQREAIAPHALIR